MSYVIYVIELFSEDEYKITKSINKLPLLCYKCNSIFYCQKKKISFVRKHGDSVKDKRKYCSITCGLYKSEKVSCKLCDKVFYKKRAQLKKHPNNFCSNRCSALFNNANRTTGYRRSKLEIFLESELTKKLSDLNIIFNNRKIFGVELDIYIPSLSLAFELNGIVHFKPIYGEERFLKIKMKDGEKKHICELNYINLIIIDVSTEAFSIKKAQKHLDFVLNKISELSAIK